MATIGTSRIVLGLATFALLAGCGSSAASTTAAPGKAQAAPAVSKDRALGTAYYTALEPVMTSLGTAMTASGTACNGTDAECRASVVHDRDLAYAMQTVMNDHPAPACMGPAPHDYTAGNNLVIQLASDIIGGIDNNDVTSITKGTDEMKQAATLFNQANAEVSKGTC